MTNNDLLRRLRYALNLNGESIAGLCALGGHEIKPIDVLKLLKKEEETGFVACDDEVMGAFPPDHFPERGTGSTSSTRHGGARCTEQQSDPEEVKDCIAVER